MKIKARSILECVVAARGPAVERVGEQGVRNPDIESIRVCGKRSLRFVGLGINSVEGEMAFIPEVTEKQADQSLRQCYSEIRDVFGFLPHFWQAQGSRIDIVRTGFAFWRAIYRTGTVPPALKEKIGLVVSAANVSSYCIIAHLELLRGLGVDKALGRKLTHNYEVADVPEEEKAAFRLAEKITREPFNLKEADIAGLRRHGWDDAAIFEVCLVASHFNFLNRLAASLGVVPDQVF